MDLLALLFLCRFRLPSTVRRQIDRTERIDLMLVICFRTNAIGEYSICVSTVRDRLLIDDSVL